MSQFYTNPQFDAMEGIAAAGLGLLFGVFAVVMLFTLALSVVIYVLQSISMYTIAKRRGIHKPWLAWIPVGNWWILGSISDQYQYVAKGKVRNRRKVLLWLTVAATLVGIPYYIASFGSMIGLAGGTEAGTFAASAVMLVCSLATSVLSIVSVVYHYIALYDLYASCQPNNSVLYLVLSIVFNITQPIFMFICRNKDEGMPPRKQNKPAELAIEEPAVETVTEEDFVQEESPEE